MSYDEFMNEQPLYIFGPGGEVYEEKDGELTIVQVSDEPIIVGA